MISINKARKILGKQYSHLTDPEIVTMINRTYLLAEIALNMKEKVFEFPTGVIDSNKNTGNDAYK